MKKMMMKSILFASSHAYRSHHKVGVHHYADHFVRDGWKACFLSSQLSLLHLLRKKDRVFSLEKLHLWRTGGETSNGFFSYSFFSLLPVLPFWTSNFIINRHFQWTVPSLSSVLRKKGFDEVDVLWISNPQAAGLSDFVNHRFLVHRVADAWDEFDGISSQLKKVFARAHERCDLLVVTSMDLYERFRAAGSPEKVLYVPNGCDFEHFRKRDLSPPEAYKTIPRPRVVYTGIVAPWFDQDLLVSCARKFREVSFVIIGPALVDISRLRREKNIHILGPVFYEGLPPYILHSDAGMIPFKRNRFVQSVHPLKLYEYLAAGLPVVSTDWEEIRRIGSPALLADTAKGFHDALKASLEWAAEDRKRLVEFASKNDWSGRYEGIRAEIDRRSGGPKGKGEA